MKSFRIASVLVAVLLGAGLCSAQSLLVSQGQVIAFSGADVIAPTLPDGDFAPGLLLGERFGGGSGPNSGVIDDSGRVFFRAQIVDAAGGNYPGNLNHLSRGYFLGDSRGNLVKVLRGGDPELTGTIPGATYQLGVGGTNALTATPRMASNGLIMFGASIWDVFGGTILAANDSVLYAGTPGNWQILAREQSAAPGCGGATYLTDFASMAHNSTSINAAGQIVFLSTLAGTGVVTGASGNETAWFTGSAGNVQLMLRKGHIAPGLEQVTNIGNVTQMNASGQILNAVTFLTGTGTIPVTAANDTAIWIYTPGTGITEVMREGNATTFPGVLIGGTSLQSNSYFNAAGQALIGVPLTGAVLPTDNSAIYLVSTSSTSLVVRKGDAAPGIAGGTFNGLGTFNMALNDAGTVAFSSSLVQGGAITAANDSGLWIGTPGNFTLVAREGDVAPGSGGQTFGNLSGGSPMLNAAGQLLFTSPLSGGALSMSLYCFDPVLGLQPVFFPNDSVEVLPGVFKTLSSSGQIPGSNGASRPMAFANDGTLTLRPSFADGSFATMKVRIGSLTGLPRKISELTGGTQNLYLNAGLAHAGELHIVVGSASGTIPGSPFGAFLFPLNFDAYTDFTLAAANVGPYVNTVGTLGANGLALAQIVVPPLPGLAPLLLHHAYGVLDGVGNLVFVSEPAAFELVP